MRQGPRFVQLSDQLIDSLKAFFDSLDVDRSGFVEFDEICQRWRQFPPRSTSTLPPNFLEILARTVPPSGLVNFERFLAGARISIAENRVKKSQMKRVQSEGCNLHNLTDPPPLDHSNRDFLGSQPLYTTYQSRHNVHPAMGVNGNKMPPPYTGPNSVGGLDSGENYCQVQLRQKKNSTNQDSRGPSRNGHFRPISTNSATTSSSMAEVRWRDSRMSTPLGDSNRHSLYMPEHSNQVAKHEKFLEEEFHTTKKGIETAQKLIEWYEKRLQSLEKRRDMLNRGMVALDSAVHEQKLNFHRAQVSELNRRIQNLMASSEKGFPSHQNMIRNAVPPNQSNSSGQTSTCSTPDLALSIQNQRLLEELESKSRLIEQLQREKRFHESHNLSRRSYNPSPVNAIYMQSRATPTAYVKPAMIQTINGFPPSPVKMHDTLL